MGSATRRALAGTRAELAAIGRAELPVAGDLLAATRVIAATPHLRTALTDNEADRAEKRAPGARLRRQGRPGGRRAPRERGVAAVVVGPDLLDGLEELGLRVAADAAGDAEVDAELYAFQRTVASDAELELALGSSSGRPRPRSRSWTDCSARPRRPRRSLIVRHLVQSPRGRRIGGMLRHAASVVADQRGFDVATVTSASP